jgi:hypothetical protein
MNRRFKRIGLAGGAVPRLSRQRLQMSSSSPRLTIAANAGIAAPPSMGA